jgi:excinuclease UvrABC ATPase subunit
MLTIRWNTVDEDGDEISNLFPAKWAICERCEGNGQHDNPAFSNGITSSEYDEDWTEEEMDAYMDGHYDVSCQTCKGSGKVLEIDEKAVEANADLSLLYKQYLAYEKEMLYIERIYASERRMGA